MTDKRKPKSDKKKPVVEDLKVDKETVQELTEEEAQQAVGGWRHMRGTRVIRR